MRYIWNKEVFTCYQYFYLSFLINSFDVHNNISRLTVFIILIKLVIFNKLWLLNYLIKKILLEIFNKNGKSLNICLKCFR